MTTNAPPTLLVLAAGMGSRYGSLKQLDPFGPNGETLIEYSVFDAVRAGFGKVVFVIRQSMATDFTTLVLDKFTGFIPVDFVFQELGNLPPGYKVPENREKPWGTGQAVLVAGTKIKEPFAVINGDDFYGYDSFRLIADFLKEESPENQYGLVGFRLKNTLSEHGAVSRGICEINQFGFLESVTELTQIYAKGQDIFYKNEKDQEIALTGNEIVSMNLMGFAPTVFPYFEKYFTAFLAEKGHLPKSEFYLPEVLNKLVQTNTIRTKVLPTPEKWFGITYANDKPVVQEKIKGLIAQGMYPENLWR
jgi:NDP-sugar pyrophosphorylase family protein